jgi:FkbM family methyltransferase
MTASALSTFHVLGTQFDLEDPDASTLRETVPGHIYEPAVTVLLRELLAEPGACFLDIGALYGYFTCLAGRLAPGCPVHAFEPAPGFFGVLEANVRRNGLAAGLHRLALSDENGTMRFHGKTLLSDNNRGGDARAQLAVLGKLLRGNRQATASSAAAPAAAAGSLGGVARLGPWLAQTARHLARATFAPGREETVPTIRYDDWQQQHGVRATVAKIDVHGAEGMVLAGMERALRDDLRHVLVEVHAPQMLVKYSHRDIADMLIGSGLEVHEMIDYRTTDRAVLVPLEGQAYDDFIRPERWSARQQMMMRMLYAKRPA